MCEELMCLLEAEQAAARNAEEAIHTLDGPQPLLDAPKEKAERALAARIAAHERVSKHRVDHGC